MTNKGSVHPNWQIQDFGKGQQREIRLVHCIRELAQLREWTDVGGWPTGLILAKKPQNTNFKLKSLKLDPPSRNIENKKPASC